MKLTTKEYWDTGREKFTPYKVMDIPFSLELKKYLEVDKNKSCVEIGAYPGTYLCYLAKTFGYQPTAIEYSTQCNHIEELLQFNGINKYEILNQDFFSVKDLQFDIVTSFGFIEHFIDYESVIEKQIELIRKDGMLVLSVPFLGGMQGIIRQQAYKKEFLDKIYESHNLQAMNLNNLKKILKRKSMEIVFADYVLGTTVWFNWKDDCVRDDRRDFMRLANFMDKHLRHRLPSSRLWSPMILLIAKKR
ncbi:class I SAM-dependent methyltransferase [Anaerosinus massiliensis]|uniref:class I SAM-dependent methyltransferase n=1 Tax=Massilibacillus massiliensis TaxID=1806837 RepID=UPI000DA62F3B|nr:methyltransferase domain-containing protein [Massilibacillus massiliensis]